jgi:hypothetical protein
MKATSKQDRSEMISMIKHMQESNNDGNAFVEFNMWDQWYVMVGGEMQEDETVAYAYRIDQHTMEKKFNSYIKLDLNQNKTPK